MPQTVLNNHVMPFKRLSAVPGFFAFTTTRQGGLSRGPYASLNLGLHVQDDPQAVLANRKSVQPLLGLAKPVIMKQVHGTHIQMVGPDRAFAGWDSFDSGIEDCDGMATSFLGLALAVGIADCLGIVAVDTVKRVFGVAHAGWKGASLGIGAKLVHAMKQEYACDPQDLKVGLSPCLGPCCLELDEGPFRDFERAFPETWDYHSPFKDGHFKLDLWKLTSLQLAEEGIGLNSIEIQALCTKDNPDLFFSHRGDNGRTGRMMVFAGFIE